MQKRPPFRPAFQIGNRVPRRLVLAGTSTNITVGRCWRSRPTSDVTRLHGTRTAAEHASGRDRAGCSREQHCRHESGNDVHSRTLLPDGTFQMEHPARSLRARSGWFSGRQLHSRTSALAGSRTGVACRRTVSCHSSQWTWRRAVPHDC
jgi:hypothetical protein